MFLICLYLIATALLKIICIMRSYSFWPKRSRIMHLITPLILLIIFVFNHFFSPGVYEELFGNELKSFKTIPVAPKNSYRITLNLTSQSTKADDSADTSEHQHEDSIECNTTKIALDKSMEALSIYANNILYSFKEATCALRLARMLDELGPTTPTTIFERHTKVSSLSVSFISFLFVLCIYFFCCILHLFDVSNLLVHSVDSWHSISLILTFMTHAIYLGLLASCRIII